MSLDVVPFTLSHLDRLEEQPSQAYLANYLTPSHRMALAANPHCFAILSGDRVIACAGVAEEWPGRALCFAMIAKECRREFLALHNIVQRYLEICPYDRIEAAVDCNFENGHRWVRALGFELEAPVMRKFLPGGADCSLYAIVRK